MDKVVLQIPMPRTLRQEAESVAVKQGFSSLQELLRVFMNSLVRRKVDITFGEVVQLSKDAEARYAQMDDDFGSNENVFLVKDADDLIDQLHED